MPITVALLMRGPTRITASRALIISAGLSWRHFSWWLWTIGRMSIITWVIYPSCWNVHSARGISNWSIFHHRIKSVFMSGNGYAACVILETSTNVLQFLNRFPIFLQQRTKLTSRFSFFVCHQRCSYFVIRQLSFSWTVSLDHLCHGSVDSAVFPVYCAVWTVLPHQSCSCCCSCILWQRIAKREIGKLSTIYYP